VTSGDKVKFSIDESFRPSPALRINNNNNVMNPLNRDDSSHKLKCPDGYDSEVFRSLPLDIQIEMSKKNPERYFNMADNKNNKLIAG